MRPPENQRMPSDENLQAMTTDADARARWWKTRNNEIFVTVWDAMMGKSLDTEKATWAIVYTNDAKEYKGYIHLFGHKKEKKDLTLKLPIRIVRNDDSTVREEFQVGDEIYFKESDLNRIIFLEE